MILKTTKKNKCYPLLFSIKSRSKQASTKRFLNKKKRLNENQVEEEKKMTEWLAKNGQTIHLIIIIKMRERERSSLLKVERVTIVTRKMFG